MTTKKQRREQVAEKRAKYDAESRRMGLEAQQGDRLRREQRMADAEQATAKRHNKPLPDNLAESYANAQTIPKDWDSNVTASL